MGTPGPEDMVEGHHDRGRCEQAAMVGTGRRVRFAPVRGRIRKEHFGTCVPSAVLSLLARQLAGQVLRPDLVVRISMEKDPGQPCTVEY